MLAALHVATRSLERLERGVREVLDVRTSEQRLARAMNELLLSGGATSARTQAGALLPRLDAGLRHLSGNFEAGEVRTLIAERALPVWEETVPLVRSMLDARTLAAEDTRDQIALGRTLAGFERLSAALDEAVQAADDDLAGRRARIQGLLVAGGALAVLLALALMMHLYGAVFRSLGGAPEDMADALGAVARGDLGRDVPVRPGDASSAMASLSAMRGSLESAVLEIRDASRAVGGAAREIAQGHAELSSRTEEQAASLEQTAASMEQMNATVAQNAEAARSATSLAAECASRAAQGGRSVDAVVGAMAAITESSRRIEAIVGVIDGLAFQTNLLSLNAAIEAARAGEQGRGFGVVAREVRGLAQRSAESATDIRRLIADASSRVQAGARQAQEAGGVIGEVVSSVQRMSGLVTQISSASQEQAESVRQVACTVQQLEQVTQQNAAMVEEATAASAVLESQAGALEQSVAAFSVAEAGALPVPVAARPTRPGLRLTRSAAG